MNNFWGIYLNFANNNTLMDNYIVRNQYGIRLNSSSCNNSLKNNVILNNTRGIYLYSACEDNILSQNLVEFNKFGIGIESTCLNNLLFENNLTRNNDTGLLVTGNENEVHDNIIMNNQGLGVNVTGDFNVFWNNLIFQNYDGKAFNQIRDTGTNNIWYNNIFSNQTDYDGDGLSDVDEILTQGTRFDKSDTDNDNVNDGFEVSYGTDPLNPDTDGDGYLDGIEIAQGTNPLNPNDYPGKASEIISITDLIVIILVIGAVAVAVASIGINFVLFSRTKKMSKKITDLEIKKKTTPLDQVTKEIKKDKQLK